MTAPPIPAVWDGEVFRPIRHMQRICDRHFVVGEEYRLVEHVERSHANHNHFFARLHDLWQSLPDKLAVQFPTQETLRKHALIMTGHRRERKFVASSVAEARKLAAFLAPQPGDEGYAIISLSENVVIEWKPASQARNAMPSKVFTESKQAVLAWIEDLIGVAPEASPPPSRSSRARHMEEA